MTKKQPKIEVTLANLEEILEVHGANLARMPEKIAHDIQALINQSTKAAQIYHKAEFLDRALNQSSLAQINTETGFNISKKFNITALEASIQQAIANTQQDDSQVSNSQNFQEHKIIDLASRRLDTNHAKQHIASHNQTVFKNWKTSLAAPGLIAASLMMGVFFGANGGTTILLGEGAIATMASNEFTDDILYLDTDYNLGDITKTINEQ